MLDTYKVLGAMLALDRFTVADLAQFSKVKIETVRTVVGRKESLLDRVGQQSATGRGGRYIEYKLKPDAIDVLRTSMKEVVGIASKGAAQATSGPDIPKIPLGILAAEDLLVREFGEATDLESKRHVLDLARINIEGGQREAQAVLPNQTSAFTNVFQRVEEMRNICEASLRVEEGLQVATQSARTKSLKEASQLLAMTVQNFQSFDAVSAFGQADTTAVGTSSSSHASGMNNRTIK